jgi:cbb3-type cytochrome oxidase maturation protein
MDVIYGLIPSMIVIGLILVALLFWSAKSGQFDDLEGEGHRILMDDDLEVKKIPKKEATSSNEAVKAPHQDD